MKKPILTFQEFSNCYKLKGRHLEVARQWLPLYPSEGLAELAAALITDGHIDWNDYDGVPRPKKLILYSNDKRECEWFLDLARRLFNVRGKLIKYRPSKGFSQNFSFKAIVYCAQLARLLIMIGVPCGDKTLRSYLIPDWITNGNLRIRRAFLRILFNFDGSLTIRKNRNATFEMNFVFNKKKTLENNGKIYIQQIISLLRTFGIRAGKVHIRPNKNDKLTFMLFITNVESVVNFHRYVGFLSERKKSKLKRAMVLLSTYGRLYGHSHILQELKEKIGTDKESVIRVNAIAKDEYTSRQFEHMRRGEGPIPLDMLNAAHEILGKKERFSINDLFVPPL